MIQEESEHEEIVEPLPQFGEIQGEQIKLAGLDYSLLHQETAKERKSNIMKQIKSKLSEMTYKIPVDKPMHQGSRLTIQNDQLTKNIMMTNNIKPNINQSTFYLFPTQMEFAPHLPELITRRFGRMHTQPLYIHHSKQNIEEFRQLLMRDERLKVLRREQQKQTKKIVPEFQIENGSDSDDIFGGNSHSQNEVNINIGHKLNFGVKDDDIFGRPRYKEVVEEIKQQPKIMDKYDFLKKKQKPNQDDGYGQCYAETGPSLQEMKQLKKQGIQLFGDAKQFVRKQKKINLNKDYQKIKRIIEQKSKKA